MLYPTKEDYLGEGGSFSWLDVQCSAVQEMEIIKVQRKYLAIHKCLSGICFVRALSGV